MSREIKFKFYEKNAITQKWRVMLEVRACGGINNFFMREGMKKCQFTGLNDKNGREIFEGDIVSTFYPELPIGTVIFDGATCAYRVRAGDILLPIVTARFIEGKFSELLPVAERILGNIFENPELLKV